MADILYAVSPIGLGHASRAVAVGLKLRESGLEVEFAAGGRATRFIESYQFNVHDIVTEPIPSERDGVMRYPALWYVRYWRGYRSTRARMAKLLAEMEPKLVVGDEEFSSVSIALERGNKQVLVSDELELGFAQTAVSRYIEGRVSEWYRALQRSVSSILVPDFGLDHGNVHFVSPVVRVVTAGREELLGSLGIPTRSKIILLSASGSGIGEFLLRATMSAIDDLNLSDAHLVVTGFERGADRPNTTYVGLYRDNQNLVAYADLVISTAGKSTIDEALSTGTPIVTIPIKNHVEQERNASALGFTHNDIHRLGPLITERLGKRGVARNYHGADAIAEYLRSSL